MIDQKLVISTLEGVERCLSIMRESSSFRGRHFGTRCKVSPELFRKPFIGENFDVTKVCDKIAKK